MPTISSNEPSLQKNASATKAAEKKTFFQKILSFFAGFLQWFSKKH
jgi:hypothetical protein